MDNIAEALSRRFQKALAAIAHAVTEPARALTMLLFCLFAGSTATPAQAQENNRTYGNWTVGLQNNNLGYYASTVNDSDLILGEYCYFSSKSCTWIVGGDTECVNNASYPTLGNTDQGAAPLELLCMGKPATINNYAYAFKNWKLLEGMIKRSTMLGLAVPMKGDQFTVWRFSLTGMNAALADMESTFFGRVSPQRSAPTGTSTINL